MALGNNERILVFRIVFSSSDPRESNTLKAQSNQTDSIIVGIGSAGGLKKLWEFSAEGYNSFMHEKLAETTR